MKQKVFIFFSIIFITLSVSANILPSEHYFSTLDTRNGLSQNTVNSILQDRNGFMWFGTKDGLNRYDGLNFRVYKKETSELKNNFITALYEDNNGNIWIGSDAGVYIYKPEKDNFEAFKVKTKSNEVIERSVTSIISDSNDNIWIAVDDQGLFKYDIKSGLLSNMGAQIYRHLGRHNVTRFWFDKETCWFSLYDTDLYFTKDNFSSFERYADKDGNHIFCNDIVNSMIVGPHNCWYIGTSKGLFELNRTTGNSRLLLCKYVRDLKFRNNKELWIGTETGLFIYHLEDGSFTHHVSSRTADPYALADNAIYSIYQDNEESMWIGSYFGGLNYYPRQLSYFEKYYVNEKYPDLGRRVREFCEDNNGIIWFGTEDEGLFNYNPQTRKITAFKNSLIGHNIHGLCLDGESLWVGTFDNGLNRIDLSSGSVRHYDKGTSVGSLTSSNAFCVYKTIGGDVFVGTTFGLFRYNRKEDNFIKIKELKNIFVESPLKIEDGFNS